MHTYEYIHTYIHTYRDNRILECSGKGIDVYEGGCGTYEGNEICNNSMDGVVVRTRGNPTFKSNRKKCQTRTRLSGYLAYLLYHTFGHEVS